MPITISLKDLVQLEGNAAKKLWPRTLLCFAEKLKDNPHERSTWKVLADYFDEEQEPEMARACRVIGRKDVVIEVGSHSNVTIKKLPALAGAYVFGWNGVISLVAEVATNIVNSLLDLDRQDEIEPDPPFENSEPEPVKQVPIYPDGQEKGFEDLEKAVSELKPITETVAISESI